MMNNVEGKELPLPARELPEHPVRMHPLMPNPTPEGFGKHLREMPASEIEKSNDFLAGIEHRPADTPSKETE